MAIGSARSTEERLRWLEAVTDAGLAQLSVDRLLEELLDRVRELMVWGSRTGSCYVTCGFQAAGSYWLISPPRTGRRRILPRSGSGTGDSGRGGRSWRA